MRAHDRFTELCALAASGQLSADEHKELDSHLEQCGVCREALAEFRQVVCRELPQSRSRGAELLSLVRVRPSEGSRSAFLRRARQEGIRMSAEVERGRSAMPFAWRRVAPYAAACLLSGAVALSGYVALERSGQPAAPSTQSPEVAELRSSNAALRAQLDRANALAESRGREAAAAQAQLDELAARQNELQRMVDDTRRSAAALQGALAAANVHNADLDAHVREASAAVAQTRSEMENLRAAKLQSEAALVAQEVQIQDLSQKLRLQSASLDMDRQLLAANREVRDLMGARNLHITDVHDFDANGNQAKVFGRIFYTEGKSLIFYAFDLGERRLENAKYSFQAWGQQEGNKRSARSLGLMFQDDKSQKRWVLKVDNPELLRRIDSVFVTVEPAGGGKKPTGQKLMYAYLGDQPNHP